MLIREIAGSLPEFAHVRSERILVVSGEARRASRATIRPMRFAGGLRTSPSGRRKPKVSFRGRDILYVLTLRPLFFRASTAEQRIETVIHELFHLSQAFDGTLDPERRHDALPKAAFERQLRPLVKRYLATCASPTLARFRVTGEVLVRQWLEKPPGSMGSAAKGRRRYDEAHTFLGPMRMITRKTRH
jgi:hypothetical protein